MYIVCALYTKLVYMYTNWYIYVPTQWLYIYMGIWGNRDIKRRAASSVYSFHSKVGAKEAYTVYASFARTFEWNEETLEAARRFMSRVDLY